ncbi:MAG TPA: hypothetical protein VFG74_16105 [Miltoncostaeaceae bacterium]|nr:hypothetical protein [Miltoncostaeaceae bacterium]
MGRPSPDDHALAASLAPDGVFRVAPARGSAPVPRLRRRVALTAAALAMCAIPAAGLAGLAQGGADVPGAVSDAGVAAAEARYRAALALGNDGRYAAAAEKMRTVIPYRSSEAAVRSWSTRAAQRLLADAGRIAPTDPDRARGLVRRAGTLAPWLSGLPAARAAVGLSR